MIYNIVWFKGTVKEIKNGGSDCIYQLRFRSNQGRQYCVDDIWAKAGGSKGGENQKEEFPGRGQQHKYPEVRALDWVGEARRPEAA